MNVAVALDVGVTVACVWMHGGVRLVLSGIIVLVVSDSSCERVITVGAPQSVRAAVVAADVACGVCDG